MNELLDENTYKNPTEKIMNAVTEVMKNSSISFLFSTIPTEDALILLAELELQKDDIYSVKLYLSTTYFLCNGKHYKQKNGNSDRKPFITDLMEAVEEEAISSSDMKTKCLGLESSASSVDDTSSYCDLLISLSWLY